MSVAEILKELPKLSVDEREAVERKLGEIRGLGLREDPARLQDYAQFMRDDCPADEIYETLR
jgi:hypothetical protein